MDNIAKYNGKRSLILHLYLKLMPVQLLSSITVSLCTIINTLIINNTLGAAGLSEFKVIDAVTNLVVIFTTVLSAGEIILVSRAICKGEKDIANRLFSTAIAVSAIFGAVMCIACFFFTEPICTYFGADADMLEGCSLVLKGNLPYYIAMPLCSVFLALFQMCSDMKTPIISSTIVFVTNVSLNYIFLSVLKLDIFYAALACSLAQITSLVFLLIRHRMKHFAEFSFKSISPKGGVSLLSGGITETAARIWAVIKFSFMIKIMAAVGGAAALSCFSIISSVDAVTFGLFSTAFQVTTLMIAGISINEGDRATLRKTAKTSLLLAMGIAVVLSAVMFLSAYPMAKLYGVADVASHLKAQRIFSFAFIFYMPYLALTTFYAALDKKKAVNIISIFTGLVLPLVAMITLGKLFGIVGFWHGLFAGDLLSLIATLLYSVIYNRHFPRSVDELLCLGDDFGVDKKDTFILKVGGLEDAIGASEKIIGFCTERGVDRRTAYYSGLCLEEIAVNIASNGFEKGEKNGMVELAVICEKDSIRLIVRDNCKEYNPAEKLEVNDGEDMLKGIGIRIVTGLAETAYKNMYGLNIISMTLKRQNS